MNKTSGDLRSIYYDQLIESQAREEKLRERLAQERERCAREATRGDRRDLLLAREIAAAIRSMK